MLSEKKFYAKVAVIGFILLIFGFLLVFKLNFMSEQNIRQPAVAGKFYSSNPEELSAQIESFLEEAEKGEVRGEVRALMVPHAGYVFSGRVAAQGYGLVQGESRKTVVLLCNSHTSHFEGLALSPASAWATPLGEAEVNEELNLKLEKELDSAEFNAQAHQGDHTLEVQVPFLQSVLKPGFKILPILFGNLDSSEHKDLTRFFRDNLGQEDLLIASSDMSHFPPYEEANRIDPQTLEIITKLDTEELENHLSEAEEQQIPGEETLLCGVDGVKTVIDFISGLKSPQAQVIDYKNSGDTELGDKESVVGYGVVAFTAEADSDKSQVATEEDLSEEERNILLKIAEQTVESYITSGKVPEFDVTQEKLNRKNGVFVTIKKGEELRGCIGQIVQTEKPLWKSARDMAIAAATKDNRFSPVREEELPDLTYEISVLSVPKKIEDWQKIELGKHGVIVRKGNQSGVFLPQVAEEMSGGKEEFLSQLCWQKAGLPPESYKTDEELEMYTFTSEVFSN